MRGRPKRRENKLNFSPEILLLLQSRNKHTKCSCCFYLSHPHFFVNKRLQTYFTQKIPIIKKSVRPRGGEWRRFSHCVSRTWIAGLGSPRKSSRISTHSAGVREPEPSLGGGVSKCITALVREKNQQFTPRNDGRALQRLSLSILGVGSLKEISLFDTTLERLAEGKWARAGQTVLPEALSLHQSHLVSLKTLSSGLAPSYWLGYGLKIRTI